MKTLWKIVITITFIILFLLVIFKVIPDMSENKNMFKMQGNVDFRTNYSVAPVEQHCKDIGMELLEGNLFMKSGCLDTNGEIHYYAYNYSEGYWIIGNKSYLAEWSS